jgi:DNA-directed RNA polymerase subunit RPC12/RpoP
VSSYKCLNCGATVFGDSFGRRFTCSTCEQTETIKQQSELDRAAADRRAEDQRYQFEQQQRLAEEAMWQQRYQADLDREATVNAIMDAARYSAESGQSAEDVRQYSLTYIHDEWATGSNPHGMQIYFDEDGVYRVTFEKPPYLTPHLQSVFKKGIQETISLWTPPGQQHIQDNVRAAGEQVLNSFYIPWTVPETGYVVKSVDYYTGIEIDLNPVNGMLTYKFNKPFKSTELNNAYHTGLESRRTQLNGHKERQERVDALNEYHRAKNKERLWDLFTTLTVGLWPVWLVILIIAWLAS